MVTFDTTVTVAALVGAVSGLIALSNTLIQWQRGRSRARVDIWMGRGLRPDEPAVCFRIHNWGGRPLAPRAFVAITGTVFRRHRQPLVGVGPLPRWHRRRRPATTSPTRTCLVWTTSGRWRWSTPAVDGIACDDVNSGRYSSDAARFGLILTSPTA